MRIGFVNYPEYYPGFAVHLGFNMDLTLKAGLAITVWKRTYAIELYQGENK